MRKEKNYMIVSMEKKGKKMNSEKPIILSVAEIFEKEEYHIPIYQRNYTWKEIEINKLLEDIDKNVRNEESKNYYLGNLIVNQDNKGVFEVIDGQQRLTTLFLLCRYLNLVKKEVLKFEAREKYNKTLANIVTLFDNDNLEKEENYAEEIVGSYKIIKSYFEGRTQKAKNDFIKKLDKVKIVRVQVPKGTDLNQYFEIMNTRGEQLELYEIAKARILGQLEKEDRKIGAEIWEACEKMDTYIQMNFSPKQRNKIFGSDWNTFEGNNFVDLKLILADKNQVEESKKTLKEMLQTPYKGENEQNGQEEEEKERFKSILSFSNFILQVNAVIHKTKGNETNLSDTKFIENMTKNWENKEKAENFLFYLLKCRFYFDNYIIKRDKMKEGKEAGEWSLIKLTMYKDEKDGNKKPDYHKNAIEPKKNNERLKSLQACLYTIYNSPITMGWITVGLRSLVNDNECDLIKELESYAREKVRDSRFEEAKGFGFKKIVFSYLDYILYRDNILNGDKGTVNYPCLNKMKDWQFRFRNSIEHFYPQVPMGDPPVFWEEEVLNHFGNLALITAPDNARFSNLPPETKAEKYSGIVQQSLKLTIMKEEMDKNKEGWTRELAKKHGEEMIKILKEECEKH